MDKERINEEEIDLRDYLEVIVRRKWIIIGVTLAAVIGAGMVSFFVLRPVYQATSILMVSKPKYQVELEPKIQTFIPSTELSLETYGNLIKSGNIEQKVIEKLSLNQPPNELTVEDLDKMLSVEIIKNTNLIKMSLEDNSPRRAMEIVNTWTNLFVKENEGLLLKEVREAQAFVKRELEASRQELFKAEEKMREFNERNKIDVLEKEIREILNKMVNYESRLADVKMSIKKEEARIEQINAILKKEERFLKLTKSIIEDPFLHQLMDRIGRDEDVLNLRFTSEELNPVYDNLAQELASSMISLHSLKTEKSELEKNIANFKKNLEALKKELAQEKLTQSRLERVVEIARQTFGVLSQKAEEIKISLGATSNTVKVVSLATEPRSPIKPRKGQNILISGVLGLFVGVLVAFFVEYWEESREREKKVK
ncbi:hypothetical protein DRJ00_09140 [Candidatus Aerophobetes bacterium]|uniref:Polysaccharide chain length determinant N-terminal domain-containing protein n=1 Tax=Aerophobetes bacterium TaxID=2030807 RepID=A0A497E333_UNCAE|nr:MAG: hypothetical protein DRJ00_09140 [Candidatus Aerophobetes bacterium]